MRVPIRWVFPLVVLALVVVMSALGVSGSSVSLYSSDDDADSLVALTPRYIRSDEWAIRTPLVIGQARSGFPTIAEVGVGRHEVTTLSDLPSGEWSMAFRPQLWGYRILPLDNAFALEWWGVAAAMAIAAYAFFLMLTGDVRWSVLGGLLVWASPFVHWWYLPGTFDSIGFAFGAAAALLGALSARRPWTTVLCTALSAWLASCFALVFYPPFQIPVALAVGLSTAAGVWALVRSGAVGRRRALVCAAAVALSAAGAFLAFALAKRGVLQTISETVYPGARRIADGDGAMEHLGSGMYAWLDVADEDGMGQGVFANASEASSFILLGLPVLVALPWVWRRRAASVVERWALGGAIGAVALLMVHMYVGIPGLAGKLTLLDRVPAKRAIIGLGVAAVIVVVLVGRGLATSISPKRSALVPGAVAGGVAGAVVMIVGVRLQQGGAELGPIGIAFTAVVAAALAGLFFVDSVRVAVAVVAIGVVTSLPVNPLQHGLDPLTDAPLVEAARSAAAAAPPGTPGTWLGTAPFSPAMLVAAGLPSLGAVNLYPDAAAWSVLDPDGDDRDVWNRYASTDWSFDPGLDEPVLEVIQDDAISVRIAPCAPELEELDVGFLITATELDVDCFEAIDHTTGANGTPAIIYRRVGGDRADTGTLAP